MPRVIYQQTVDTTEELLRKWPNLGTVVSIDDLRTGLSFYKSRGLKDFAADKQTAAEALEFYNAVIADGRFVGFMATDPAQAADRLFMQVRPEVTDLIRNSVALSQDGGPQAISPGGVVVAVVIVLVLVYSAPEPTIVVDQSGLVKV